MTCKRDDGEPCECVLTKQSMRPYCPNWYEPDRLRDNQDDWQCTNFAKLTRDQQERCVAYLRVKVPNQVRAEWMDQAARGISLGCTDLRFHFGVGMAVRNALREVVPDEQLPAQSIDAAELKATWDDFYRGALYALVAKYPVTTDMLASAAPAEPPRVRTIRREPPRVPLPENFD